MGEIRKYPSEGFWVLSILEDYEALTPLNWKILYPNQRIHMWDTTDLRIQKPTAKDLQRACWSKYYKGTVIKGGVGMCLFGWIMTGPLLTGRQSDAEYLEKSGIYAEQQKLAQSDGGPACTNLTDKGFTDSMAGWLQFGKQKLITPCFMNGSRFTPLEVLLTSDRANKRARNERAVRYTKLLMPKLNNTIPPPVYAMMWENCGFRANFVFGHLTESESGNHPTCVQARQLLEEHRLSKA